MKGQSRRAKLPEGKARSEFVHVRMQPHEVHAVRLAAGESRLSVSEWLRRLAADATAHLDAGTERAATG